ncbi:MAG: hypothetical protein AB7F74_24750 [Parvibaculaceae bacterium]
MRDKIRRINFYPDEYLAGVSGKLTIIDQGVYWMICTLVYSRGGPIADDHSWLSRLFAEANWKTVRASIDRLVAMGKVTRQTVHEGGDQRVTITVLRCHDELTKALTRIEQASDAGRTGGRPPKKNSDLGKADGSKSGKLTNNHQPVTNNLSTKEEELSSASAASGPSSEEVSKAFQDFCAAAQTHGLPVPRALAPDRRKKLVARLREVGPEGWCQALKAIAERPFLRGAGSTGWTASLDWLLSPTNLRKVLEGGYSEKTGAGKSSPTEAPLNWPKLMEQARRLRKWPSGLGPLPGRAGCRAPAELIQDGDGDGWEVFDRFTPRGN